MPLYDYSCDDGHTVERLRPYDRRDEPAQCSTCGRSLSRLMHIPHCSPDGIYSYAPNIGDPERFERQRAAIKDGVKVIPRQRSAIEIERDGNR